MYHVTITDDNGRVVDEASVDAPSASYIYSLIEDTLDDHGYACLPIANHTPSPPIAE